MLPLFALLLSVAQVTSTAPTPTATPTPLISVIAERFLRQGDTVTRVSLFSSHIVVVSCRTHDEQTLYHQLGLEDEEYITYLGALQRDAKQLEPDHGSRLEPIGSSAEISLYLDPAAPIHFSYSPIASLDLAAARLVAVFDDLQTRALEAGPFHAQVASWKPKVGDRVELLTGELARVTQVRDEDLVVLELEAMPVIKVFSLDDVTQVIRRVVDRSP